MKKLFFIAAMAGAALVSCTKNESVETPEQDVITFAEPVTALNTKATEILKDYPTSKCFSVFANYFTGNYTKLDEGKPYMKDVKTAYVQSLNAWDPKAGSGVNYYWPKQGTLTFAAYSPSEVSPYVSYDAKGIQFTDYVVESTPTQQYDLLFSERSYNQTKTTQDGWVAGDDSKYVGVDIKFNHALSSIIFNAKTDVNYNEDNFYIFLTKLSLVDVCSKGSFNQNLTDANGDLTDEDWAGWSGLADRTEYVVFEGAHPLSNSNALVPGVAPGTQSDVTDVQNSHLILLPQPLAGAKLYVEYKIMNINVSPATVIEQTATVDLSTFDVDNWFRGKRYIYNITFGLDKIYFDPIVTNWEQVTVTPDVAIGR